MSGKFKPASSAPVSLHVRESCFRFDGDITRFWFDNNPVMTHSFNAFNLVIPDNERFFVRSVMRYCEQLPNDFWRTTLKNFARQEANHARAHEAYFKWMKVKGYRFDRYLKILRKYLLNSERFSTRKYNLAITAAVEHFTAVIGILFLTEPELSKCAPNEMTRFMTWHSAEEVEHHAVAFDLMQQAGIKYPIRVMAFFTASFDFLIFFTAALLMLSWQDRLGIRQIYRAKREIKRRHPGMGKRFRKMLFAYLRPSFHPSQTINVQKARQAVQVAEANGLLVTGGA